MNHEDHFVQTKLASYLCFYYTVHLSKHFTYENNLRGDLGDLLTMGFNSLFFCQGIEMDTASHNNGWGLCR